MGPGRGDASYNLLLLKAKALVAAGNPKALESLYILQESRPGDLGVKRMIGRACFDSARFEEAAEAWMVVYLRTDSLDSLCYLLCSVLYTETFPLLFQEWGIQRYAGSPDAERIIRMILSKERFFDLAGLIESLGRGECAPSTEGRALRFHCGDPEEQQDAPANPAGPLPPNDRFYALYQRSLRLIAGGAPSAGLDVLLGLYRQETHEALLQYLESHEKWEILLYLHEASTEYARHYECAAGAMRSAKIRTLHALMTRSLSSPVLEELVAIL